MGCPTARSIVAVAAAEVAAAILVLEEDLASDAAAAMAAERMCRRVCDGPSWSEARSATVAATIPAVDLTLISNPNAPMLMPQADKFGAGQAPGTATYAPKGETSTKEKPVKPQTGAIVWA